LEIGSYGRALDLANRIRALRRDKPVWAFVAEHAFTAGYALASQANRIIPPARPARGGGAPARFGDRIEIDGKALLIRDESARDRLAWPPQACSRNRPVSNPVAFFPPLPTDPSPARASGPFDQAYQEQQYHRPDRGMDDGPGNTGTDAQAQPWKDEIGNKRAYDPDHDVAKKAVAVALDDQPREPTGNCTDEQYDKETFECHSGSFPARVK